MRRGYRYRPYFVELEIKQPKRPFGDEPTTSLEGMLFVMLTTFLMVIAMFFVWTLSW